MKSVRPPVSVWSLVLVIVATMFALGTPSALAQDATPAAETELAHPAHIHSGTCDTLGDVVYPLNDIVTYTVSSSFSFGPAATPEPGATPLAGITVTQSVPVQFSFTHVDAEIGELIGGGFAINAHESAENIQNYIACGNIPQCTAGPNACALVTSVTIELAPQNESGYFGVAKLDADPDGGTDVSVFLFHVERPSSS